LDRAARRAVPPAVEDGDLVPPRVGDPEVDHLRPLPVAFPVQVLLEGRQLLELVAVVPGPVDGEVVGAVAQRRRGHLAQRLLEGIRAEAGRIPGDDDRPWHQAPTSAWIAPGPSAVLPWPSESAPTRIAI